MSVKLGLGAGPAAQLLVLRPSTNVPWNVFPFASTLTTGPSNLPRIIVPEYRLIAMCLEIGMLEPVGDFWSLLDQVSVP